MVCSFWNWTVYKEYRIRFSFGSKLNRSICTCMYMHFLSKWWIHLQKLSIFVARYIPCTIRIRILHRSTYSNYCFWNIQLNHLMISLIFTCTQSSHAQLIQMMHCICRSFLYMYQGRYIPVYHHLHKNCS